MTVTRGVPRAKRGRRERGDPEDTLAAALDLAGRDPAHAVLLAYQRQYAYVPGRRLRADFAWPAARLLVEVQGGVYSGQAHGSISGILADNARLTAATLAGFRVLRFTPDQVKGDAIAETLDVIENALRWAP